MSPFGVRCLLREMTPRPSPFSALRVANGFSRRGITDESISCALQSRRTLRNGVHSCCACTRSRGLAEEQRVNLHRARLSLDAGLRVDSDLSGTERACSLARQTSTARVKVCERCSRDRSEQTKVNSFDIVAGRLAAAGEAETG